MNKVGIIGAGNMGGAIIRGLLAQTDLDYHLIAVDHTPEKLQDVTTSPNLTVAADVLDLDGCDMIIIAVKPKDVPAVLKQIHPLDVKIVVSLAAGISLDELQAGCGKPVGRVMPNTPSLIGFGMSLISYGPGITEEYQQAIEQLFAAVGETHVLPEKQFALATALSGCGPAYVYLMMEALIDAGCAGGLKRDLGRKLVSQTFLGAAAMVKGSDTHPGKLKDDVTSPGGVTIKAVKVLEQHGVRAALWEAVEAAAKEK